MSFYGLCAESRVSEYTQAARPGWRQCQSARRIWMSAWKMVMLTFRCVRQNVITSELPVLKPFWTVKKKTKM